KSRDKAPCCPLITTPLLRITGKTGDSLQRLLRRFTPFKIFSDRDFFTCVGFRFDIAHLTMPLGGLLLVTDIDYQALDVAAANLIATNGQPEPIALTQQTLSVKTHPQAAKQGFDAEEKNQCSDGDKAPNQNGGRITGKVHAHARAAKYQPEEHTPERAGRVAQHGEEKLDTTGDLLDFQH